MLSWLAIANGTINHLVRANKFIIMITLSEAEAAIIAMSEKERAIVMSQMLKSRKLFTPNPGPQTDAYFSKADVLLFGGSPGGGKTGLEIGLGLNEHHRTLIVRKRFADLEGIIDTAKKIVFDDKGFIGGNRPKYKKQNGGVIHFAGLPEDGGIGGHQGVDHDLICVDEAATVPEKQVRLLMGWMRTDRRGQRCRMILASNPPLDSTGDWLIDYFAPWLDPRHHNPAGFGEMRYFLPADDGRGDIECNPDDFTVIRGVKVYPQSRTFIPSSFTDNPFYAQEDYAKSLAGLPDEAREILITGNFMLGRKDDIWQAIPTHWVKAAQARWTERPPYGVPMCSIGCDVAQGGTDETVLAIRHDGWYANLIKEPGKNTPSGKEVAGLVIANRRDQCPVTIDMGGGYGGSALEHLRDNGVTVHGYKGAEKSTRRTEDKQLGFVNKRSEAYWRFREALDPNQPGGSRVALPSDTALVADLTAPRYEITRHGIEIEAKEKVCKRLSRSTDAGDSVVMAWFFGDKNISVDYGTVDGGENGSFRRTKPEPKVITSSRRR